MATYAIGDVQGCFSAFERLLGRIDFHPGRDRLWFVGDLVNRGPQSLDMLRWAYRHRDSITAVLGNHDLHLLAVAAGIRESKVKDTVDDVLAAPDRAELLDWLRRRPVLYHDAKHALVHAGLLPSWTIKQAAQFAKELESALQGPDYHEVLAAVYAGPDVAWDDSETPPRRWRALADIFTRLRTCTREGEPRYGFNGPLADVPPDQLPWFAFPGRLSATHKVIFGHWAAVGLHLEPRVFALDSGCVWGQALTALRIEDEAIIQVVCG